MNADDIVSRLLEADEPPAPDASSFNSPMDEITWLMGRTPQVKREEKMTRGLLLGKHRESQYAVNYLHVNKTRGEGRGYTIGTYLAYNLRGKAKSYAGHYHRALTNAMERRVACGLAEEGTSISGGVAYYPISDAEEAEMRKSLGIGAD